LPFPARTKKYGVPIFIQKNLTCILDILAKIPGNKSQNLKFFLNSPSNKSLDGPKTDPALSGIMFTFLLSYYPMSFLNNSLKLNKTQS
jgi:hypothetical protein